MLTWLSSRRWRRYAADSGALGLLGGITALFFAPIWLGGAWLPYGGGDAASFLFPMYRFIAASWHAGELPLWNPHQYAGYPLIADNQAGLFYPPLLLLYAVWPDFSYRALEGLVMGHVYLAGAAMYLCVRGWRLAAPLGRWSALVAGVAFMFSDLFITHLGNFNLIAVAAWLPLALLALHHACDQGRGGWRWAVGAGWVVGLSALAGHGQMTFLSATLLGLYALYRSGRDKSAWPWLWLGVTGGVAIGGAALMLFPAYSLTQASLRGSFDYAQSTNYALPPSALAGLFAPDFFGRGARVFWAPWARVEAGYPGVLPWALALAALLARGGPGDRWLHRPFWLGVTVLSLWLALGDNTPLHGWLLGPLQLPFQAPARFVLLADLGLAFLAAAGLEQLRLRPAGLRGMTGLWLLAAGGVGAWLWHLITVWGEAFPARRPMMQEALGVWLGLALLSAIWLWWAQHRRGRGLALGAVALALTAGDLILLGSGVEIDRQDPTTGFQHTAALAYLQAQAGLNRIDEATAAWQPGTAQLAGLYSAGGVFNPLALASHTVYMGSVGYRGSPPYNLMGIQYIVAGKQEPPGDTRFIRPVFNQDPAVDIYLNTRALPRVRMAYGVHTVADQAAAFDALHATDFDPTATVILEKGDVVLSADCKHNPVCAGRPQGGAPSPHTLSIVAYSRNRVALDVTTEAAGYLVLSDMFFPGWEAFLDGQPVPLLRADYAFRAVLVPAGTHQVTMVFHPPGWLSGVAVSALTATGTLAALGWGWWRGRGAHDNG